MLNYFNKYIYMDYMNPLFFFLSERVGWPMRNFLKWLNWPPLGPASIFDIYIYISNWKIIKKSVQ